MGARRHRWPSRPPFVRERRDRAVDKAAGRVRGAVEDVPQRDFRFHPVPYPETSLGNASVPHGGYVAASGSSAAETPGRPVWAGHHADFEARQGDTRRQLCAQQGADHLSGQRGEENACTRWPAAVTGAPCRDHGASADMDRGEGGAGPPCITAEKSACRMSRCACLHEATGIGSGLISRPMARACRQCERDRPSPAGRQSACRPAG